VLEAGRSELVELATPLIIEEAWEGEVRDVLERDYYERGSPPGPGTSQRPPDPSPEDGRGQSRVFAQQVTGLDGPFPLVERLARAIRITPFERRQLAALRQELDHDYEAAVDLDTTRSKPAPATKIPSTSRT
jgi:hypothetical protein